MLLKLKDSLKRLVHSKYSDWGGFWVHYTKEPFIKINPKSIHRDPAGIYLFPDKFEPVPMWKSLPYKFVVTVPKDLKVLDIASLTREDMLNLVRGVTEREVEQNYVDLILNGKDFLRNGWEAMYMPFMGKSGEFNKRFRKLGYEAIFDDTKTIHSMEVQLLLLDPRKAKVIEMTRQTGSGYDDLLLVMDFVQEMCADFGKVTVTKPKKKKQYGEERLAGGILVENGENYLDLVVSVEHYAGADKKRSNPTEIHVGKKFSRPDIGMGAGASFDRSKRSFAEIEKDIGELLKKIFK